MTVDNIKTICTDKRLGKTTQKQGTCEKVSLEEGRCAYTLLPARRLNFN